MEHKFTDKEIIKALESCSRDNIDCEQCPANGSCDNDEYCFTADILDLINRQKAEIERLEEDNKGLSICLDSAVKTVLEIKSRALTEYVTELEKRLIAGGLGIAFVRTQMHKLLKEKTEGE